MKGNLLRLLTTVRVRVGVQGVESLWGDCRQSSSVNKETIDPRVTGGTLLKKFLEPAMFCHLAVLI